jgi:hypothetical protein
LPAHLTGPRQGHGEDLLQGLIAVDLAPDIAARSAEAGAQEPELAVVALELLGVSVVPSHQRRPFGDPDIGLPQRHAVVPGLAAEHDDRLVHQPGVGRKGHVLGLHSGIHNDPLQVLGSEGAGLVGDRQALLQQGRKLRLAQALAPARQRRALEGQNVLEALLAAEKLIVGVL